MTVGEANRLSGGGAQGRLAMLRVALALHPRAKASIRKNLCESCLLLIFEPQDAYKISLLYSVIHLGIHSANIY